MYFPEEDGAMIKMMLVQCCECGRKYIYRRNHVPSDFCMACGETKYNIIEDNYTGVYIESTTEPTITDQN